MNPRVYQCIDENSIDFGAVAVKLPDGSPLGAYGVMTLNRGGDFRTVEQIEGSDSWTSLTSKQKK